MVKANYVSVISILRTERLKKRKEDMTYVVVRFEKGTKLF